MSIKPIPFRLVPLAVASMVLIWSAGAAQAALVLGASSSASVDGEAVVPNVTGPSSSYVNSSSDIATLRGTGSGRAFAAGSGAYAVSSSATGIATGAANATFANTFTNETGVEQFYTLNFFIYGGSISTKVFDPLGLGDDQFLRAGYGASIKFNGDEVFSSTAELFRNATVTTLDKTGTALNNGTLSGDVYSWSSAAYSVSLGLVAAGGTFNILAEVLDYAEADVGVYTLLSGGGFQGAATAFYGDPLDVDASPPPGQFQLIPSVVPEPGSMGLVAGAMGAGLLGMRRRRRDGLGQG